MRRQAGILLFVLNLIFWAAPWRALFADPKPKISEVARIYMTVTVPVAPPQTGTCAASVAHCVILTWTAPTTNAAGGALVGTLSYDVLRSTTSGSGYTKITTTQIAATTFEDDVVTAGTTYYYVVVAYQTTSAGESAASANSNQASAAVPLPPPAPGPPTGAAAVAH